MLASSRIRQRLWQSTACLLLACVVNAAAQTGPSTGPFINVNGKYVLYTYPAAPYTRKSAVYVPLVSFAELLGIRVTQSAQHGTVSLLLNGKTTVFKKTGNLLTGAGHVPTEMLGGGELAVALAPLLTALHITYQKEANGIRVTDQRFLNPNLPSGQHFNYANGLPNRYKDWDGYFVDQSFPESKNFIPMQFSLTRNGKFVTVQAKFKLRQPKKEGSGVSMYVYNSNQTVRVKGDGLKPPPEPPALPSSDFCQYSAGTVVCKTSIDFSKGGHVNTVLIHAFQR